MNRLDAEVYLNSYNWLMFGFVVPYLPSWQGGSFFSDDEMSGKETYV